MKTMKTLLRYTLYILATPISVLTVVFIYNFNELNTITPVYAAVALGIQSVAITVLVLFEDKLLH